MDEAATAVPDQVREACGWVAALARSVSIEQSEVAAYAAELSAAVGPPPPDPVEDAREARLAGVICLDAINFGSGWWPTIRKRPGQSGYSTIAAGLSERFRAEGAWSATELIRLTAAEIAEVVGQAPDHPLMAQYAASLGDVGRHLLVEYGGHFEALVDAAAGSAVALVGLLASWDAFADVSTYEQRPVPFFKRAQIAAADLNRTGIAEFRDEDRLTAFADNLVPHVLRVDGVLRLDRALEEAIDRGDLLSHGCTEEVELRACAVQAIELLAAATGGRLCPAEIDAALWNRGRDRRYKSIPRPRSRNTAY